MKQLLRSSLAAVLCAALIIVPAIVVSGCSVSQFEAVLNQVGPAVETVLEIVALVKGTQQNSAIVPKIEADTSALEKLYTDFQASATANKGSIEAEINAAFVTLNSDLGTVFAVAQVSDQNTQAKITALVGLIQSAVKIAEAAIPSPAPAAVKPLELNAGQLVDSYNKILVAKTGNPAVDKLTPKLKLRMHGKFVRFVSLGLAH